MSARVLTLLTYSGPEVTNVSSLQELILGAKEMVKFDSLNDSFLIAFVGLGENADQSSVTCSEPVVDNEEVSLLLVKHQITSVPCILASHGTDESKVFTLPRSQVPAPDAAITDGHFSAAVDAYNDFDICKAVSSFELVLHCDPNHKKALFNLASIMHMLDYPTLAVGYIVRLLLLDGADTIAHSFLWALNNTGKCTGAAIEAYTQLAEHGDLDAITKRAALTNTGRNATRGDPVYAERIYDEMASKFENKLVDCLGYRGPWLMRDLLEGLTHVNISGDVNNDSMDVTLVSATDGDASSTNATSLCLSPPVHLRPKGEWRILDVGCGSGLCGKVFHQYVRTSESTPFNNTDPSVDVNHISNLETTAKPFTSRDLPLSAVPTTVGGLMVGIDVSGKILEIAKNTGTYDCTEKYDLCDALRVLDCTEGGECVLTGLDMVIAADTFIYVGALGEVFSLVRNVLRDAVNRTGGSGSGSIGSSAAEASSKEQYGGLFMFSTEDLESSPMRVKHAIVSTVKTNLTTSTTHEGNRDTSACTVPVDSLDTNYDIGGAVPGWGGQLLKSARFAHADRYIRALCEKYRFRVLVHEKIILRTEETIPLPGNIYILQKLE